MILAKRGWEVEWLNAVESIVNIAKQCPSLCKLPVDQKLEGVQNPQAVPKNGSTKIMMILTVLYLMKNRIELGVKISAARQTVHQRDEKRCVKSTSYFCSPCSPDSSPVWKRRKRSNPDSSVVSKGKNHCVHMYHALESLAELGHQEAFTKCSDWEKFGENDEVMTVQHDIEIKRLFQIFKDRLSSESSASSVKPLISLRFSYDDDGCSLKLL
ncbi:UNVERIFIED_CONTAM: hypothetical protein H355_011829 [Colinus virginianus]|nr:hypothetical protein H355_011829 [Colinus virginianus]